MSDSNRLHATWLSTFQTELADQDFRNLDTLAWAATGLLLQKTISLPAWGSCLPDETNAATREQRFRRWLSNPHVNVRRLYQPFITQALADWSGHTLYVALDTTSVANRLVIARTAVIYRGRAVPLAWQVFKRQSVMLAFDQYAGFALHGPTTSREPLGCVVGRSWVPRCQAHGIGESTELALSAAFARERNRLVRSPSANALRELGVGTVCAMFSTEGSTHRTTLRAHQCGHGLGWRS
jgi:hypothetical protein